MDRELRDRERQESKPAILRARLRAGHDARTVWSELFAPGEDAPERIAAARELLDFTYLDTPTYRCGPLEQQVARFTHRPTGLIFCLIPSGTFRMGTPDSRQGLHSERPDHDVHLRPFLIAQTVCTRAAWDKVRTQAELIRGEGRADDVPVGGLSYFDAKAFCDAVGLRLPSEAEWEYACRAGSTLEYCFGEDAERLPEYAWYTETSSGRTHPVAQLAPNAFGLYDVHGNVQEWCEDDWHDGYTHAPTDGSPWIDPTDPRDTSRVLRGGSWGYWTQNVRSAYRITGQARDRYGFVGFRPAWGG